MEEKMDFNGFLVFFIPFLIFCAKIGPKLASRSVMWFFRPTKKENDLFEEAVSVKSAMNKISMVDEFAKYSKLQRRLNQIKLSLESDVKVRQNLHKGMTRMVVYAMYAVIMAVYLFTVFQFGRAYPVLVIPSDWFFPLNYLLSYPTGIPGAISIPAWSIIWRNILTTFIK